MASPPLTNHVLSRSLFSLTPAAQSGSTSLFSLPSTPIGLGNVDSSLPSSSQATNMSTNSNFASPVPPGFTSLFTPPAVANDSRNIPNRPYPPQSVPLSQRGQMVTPSPYKMQPSSSSILFSSPPIYSPPSQASSAEFASPSPLDASVVRVLEYGNNDERQKGKRSATEDLALPDPKRIPLPPNMTPSSPPLVPLPFKLPSVASSSGSSYESARFDSPRTVPPPNFSPPQALNTSSKPSNVVNVNSNKSAAVVNAVAPESNKPFAPALAPLNKGLAHPSVAGNIATGNYEATSFSRPIPSEPLPLSASNTSVVLVNSAYSSYNAALTAQNLIEDNGVDKWSPDMARDMFMVESGAMATALENLSLEVNKTSSEIFELNLLMQVSVNEILLSNAALTLDNRLSKLDEFFSRVTR